ncbi:MAG: prepilin peptidase [Gammaproteobacteria bacterium]
MTLATMAHASIPLVWAAACGCFDLWRRRLPNALTLGAAVLGLVWLIGTGAGLLGGTAASCLGAAVLALVLTVPAYARGQLGAGDVKLLAAIGLLAGLEALLVTYMVAGLLAGGGLWLNHQLGRYRLDHPGARGRWLPFGFLLTIGFSVAILFPEIM